MPPGLNSVKRRPRVGRHKHLSRKRLGVRLLVLDLGKSSTAAFILGLVAHRDAAQHSGSLVTPIEQVVLYHFIDLVQRVVCYESMSQFHGSRHSVPPRNMPATGCRWRPRAGKSSCMSATPSSIAERRQTTGKGRCIVKKAHLANWWKLAQDQALVPEVASCPVARFQKHVRDICTPPSRTESVTECWRCVVT
jgi:hypothetical protein